MGVYARVWSSSLLSLMGIPPGEGWKNTNDWLLHDVNQQIHNFKNLSLCGRTKQNRKLTIQTAKGSARLVLGIFLQKYRRPISTLDWTGTQFFAKQIGNHTFFYGLKYSFTIFMYSLHFMLTKWTIGYSVLLLKNLNSLYVYEYYVGHRAKSYFLWM